VSQGETLEDADIRHLAEAHAGADGALLPILHAIQDKYGYVPETAVPTVAEVLNLSRAEACQSMGSRQLEAHARHKLNIDFHETTADGRFSLEPVYCLGNCACSPAVMVDETVYGRVTPERLDEILR
jgi:formate dehydrogenase subunit gamma